MDLHPGTHLGPYEILGALGAGGMGEVYKATDTRLNRTVAIKVLPAHVASDPGSRERFEREARAVAALNHPHICTLHDIGRQDGTDYLVMEYLDGETLADRLAQAHGSGGSTLRIDEALAIAMQIADALDKAHRHGIVHRDLKPGNIMLLHRSGASGPPHAKLLDFGLAKTGVPVVAGSGLSMLPTTPRNLTAQGTILGTFQYMAPEQLEGKDADARTDIFAFGAVLYEMLTGRKAFEGSSHASLIGAIMHAEPAPLSSLVPLAPPLLDRIVRRCLAKNPDERWQSARDLVEALNWVAGAGSQGAVSTSAPAHERHAVRAWMFIATALLVAVLASLATAIYVRRSAPEPRITRLDVVTPPSTDPFSFALSPDGLQLAFVATAEGSQRLWVRSLDQVTARPLAGTDGAQFPFWSPDSRAIGFFAEGKLKRVDIAGGGAQVLADTSIGRGGAWGRDGTILFSPATSGGLWRVAATGGSATQVTHFGSGQSAQRFPTFLPDDRHFLFVVPLGQPDARGVWVGSLDGGEPRRLLASDTAAVFVQPGYLMLVSQGVLNAYPFDLTRLAITGEPIPIAQGLGQAGMLGEGVFSISDAGVLAYRSGGSGRRQLVWVDRSGKTLGVVAPPDGAAQAQPALAPDGTRVAVARVSQNNVDVWLHDVKRATMTRFTFDGAVDATPIWSPDGSRIVFFSSRNGRFDLFIKPADGSADEQPLLVTPLDKSPQDWSSDGRFLLYSVQDPKTASDLWALPMSGDRPSTSSGRPEPAEGRKPFPVVQTMFDEVHGQFAPDGRWVAYASNETGRYEIYVRPFPGPGGKWQVSTGGGIYPRWRRDGKELFYIGPDNRMMAVPVQAAGTFSAGTSSALFQTQLATGGNVGIAGFSGGAEYAVAADGRFLLNVIVGDTAASPITIVQNWDAALKK